VSRRWTIGAFWRKANSLTKSKSAPRRPDCRSGPKHSRLDILVKASEEGDIVSLYVVNYGIESQSKNFNLPGFNPIKEATVTQLGPHSLISRNSGDNPDLISPVITTKKVRRKFNHEFPGHSFTVIRLKNK
jgi:alpha-L-arabinofuranosidase